MTSNETSGIELFKKIGFKKIGEWKIKDDKLEIEYCNDQYNNKESFSFSYAFTNQNTNEKKEKIIYVGQSIKGCFNRFNGYILAKEENQLKSTNLKVKKKLIEKLKQHIVNIYILKIENSKYKGLDINIHLGLEPALIKIAMKDDGCLNGKRFKNLPQNE